MTQQPFLIQFIVDNSPEDSVDDSGMLAPSPEKRYLQRKSSASNGSPHSMSRLQKIRGNEHQFSWLGNNSKKNCESGLSLSPNEEGSPDDRPKHQRAETLSSTDLPSQVPTDHLKSASEGGMPRNRSASGPLKGHLGAADDSGKPPRLQSQSCPSLFV